MQLFAVVAAGSISIAIWYNYAQLKLNSNFDDSLAIYRYYTLPMALQPLTHAFSILLVRYSHQMGHHLMEHSLI